MLTLVDSARYDLDGGTYKMRNKKLRVYIDDEDVEYINEVFRTLEEMKGYLTQVVDALNKKRNKEIYGSGSWLDDIDN